MPTDNDIFFSIDPAGTAVMSSAIFDTESRDLDRPAMIRPASSSTSEVETNRRRKLLPEFSHFGIPVPDRLALAYERLDAVKASGAGSIEPPDISRLAPSKITAAIESHMLRLAAAEQRKPATSAYLGAAHLEVWEAGYEAVDVVLSELAPEFDRAAGDLADVFPAVRGLWTVSDAATADDTGEAVALFHRAVRAASSLDRIADLVLGLGTRVAAKSGSTVLARSAVNHARVLTLSGVAGDPVELEREIARTHFRNGKFDKDRSPDQAVYPFGVHGLVLASDGALSLPGSYAEWTERVRDYESEKGVALHALNYYVGDDDRDDDPDL